jgi:hypothetical protein
LLRLSAPDKLSVTRLGEAKSKYMRSGSGESVFLLLVKGVAVELSLGDQISVQTEEGTPIDRFVLQAASGWAASSGSATALAAPAPASSLNQYPCYDAEGNYKPRPYCKMRCCRKRSRSSDDESESGEAQGEGSGPAARRRTVSEETRWLESLDTRLGQALPLSLSRRYPLTHADPLNDAVAEKLNRMEKYEIALQGDDYADKDNPHTNTEAVTYAKSAATVRGLTWGLSSLCMSSSSGRKDAEARLRMEPHIGSFRAKQIVEIVRSGTCSQLEDFEANRAPVGSDGVRREYDSTGRSMHGAASKHSLRALLGVSALRAADLYEGTHNPGLPRIESIADLRRLGPEHLPCTFPVPSLYLPCTFPVPQAAGPRAPRVAPPGAAGRRGGARRPTARYAEILVHLVSRRG